jgi:hypothetical protein
MSKRRFIISKLDRIYFNRKTGKSQLSMAEITGHDELGSFSELRDYVMGLSYPTPQADKMECYGWVPTVFYPGDHTFKRSDGGEFTRNGCWRTGEAEAEADGLSVFYADVDNATEAQPMVTMEEVAANLNALGSPFSFFLYTSFSHTDTKPKFRVVIETDRDISRAEMQRLAIYLNWEAFGQQADLSIYDPGDFVFAPPHRTISLDQSQGGPMDVGAMLKQQVTLQAEQPESVARYTVAKQPRVPKKQPSAARLQKMAANALDRSVRPGVNFSNPSVFNPFWADLYQECGAVGHWQTMRSILGMVWAKNGGDMTYGEMDLILRKIDATDGDYYAKKYGEDGIAEVLTWLTSLPVESKEPDWLPVLEQEETGLVIGAKEAECGEGKTHDELGRMAREKGRYVYAVAKITDMQQRREEFAKIAGQTGAYAFTIKEAHSASGDLRVSLQLQKIRAELDRLPAGKPIIVFVTQQGVMQMDWSRWGDFEVILDEVPEVFATYQIKAKTHANLLREYVHVETEDGDCYRLGLTGKGRDLAASTDIDDYDSVHYGLTLMMARNNAFVWVKRDGWDNPAENGRMEFFAITSPLNLAPFKAVRMLGDELRKSVTAKIWSEKWGVKFSDLGFPKRTRLVATHKRVSILYFAEHRDSSITRFREGDIPLAAISEFIQRDAGSEPVLWTANEKLKSSCNLPDVDFASPKSHGRNDLQHFGRVAWLAAMKASKFEIGSLRSVCGMTSQELTDWREYNALYQFVMRSILRDFDSAAPVTIYVFSRMQADYLQRRLGGTIRRVPDIVIDRQPRSIHHDGPMSSGERAKAKYWRDKMTAAGVSDVRQLPPSAPLAKLDERMIRLINATAIRSSNDNGVAEAA